MGTLVLKHSIWRNYCLLIITGLHSMVRLMLKAYTSWFSCYRARVETNKKKMDGNYTFTAVKKVTNNHGIVNRGNPLSAHR